MIKKQAHYKLTVYSNEDTITITDPITCHFNITRGVLSDNNSASIQLYNLAPTTRDKIFQDAFVVDWQKFKYVYLEAGYGDCLSLIFKGRILQAYSHKAGGQTDVTTEIQAMALDIFDCKTSYTFKAGTSKREAFQTMVLDMPNVKLTNMGSLDGVFLTDTTFDGNTMENLSKLTGGNVFVDNDQVNCLKESEVIDVPVPIISEDSVLLETPRRRDANIDVTMLFQPDLLVGQLLEIRSGVFPKFNGQFKVLGFTHDCTISNAIAGNRITTVNLYVGTALTDFSKVKGEEITPVGSQYISGWVRPARGRVTSGWGYRIHPIFKQRIFHKGIDIGANRNDPVVAAYEGTVLYVGVVSGYGNYISIAHGTIEGKNVVSFYAHLQSFNVTQGQHVTTGQLIGRVGSTGYSTGPHLHFGIEEDKKSANPAKYVKDL